MKYHLYFDSEKCSACGACALACMDQNDIVPSRGQHPFRHTFTCESTGGDLHFFSSACGAGRHTGCIVTMLAGC